MIKQHPDEWLPVGKIIITHMCQHNFNPILLAKYFGREIYDSSTWLNISLSQKSYSDIEDTGSGSTAVGKDKGYEKAELGAEPHAPS
jgi:hypothetical protein